MLPFFRRFKHFFMTRYMSARNKRYKLARKVKFVLKRDFIEGCVSIVRLNLRGS